MPILYKLTTALLALTGCVSLWITGEVNPLMSISCLAILPGYYRFFKGLRHAGRKLIGSLSILTLVVFVFDTRYISGDAFIAVAHLTLTFQALKSFDLKEPWDHLQVYFVSLLQLIIASELTSSLAFGGVFIFFMMILVTAMVLSHFLKEGHMGGLVLGRPIAAITLLTVIVTMAFFIAMPRSSYRFFGKSHTRGIKTSGFSDRMDFGSLGNIKLDTSIVARIELDRHVSGPLYWRGNTLDYFDGRSWRNTLASRSRITRSDDEFVISNYDRTKAVRQTVYLEPIDSEVIFGLEGIHSIKTDVYALFVDQAGSIYVPGKKSRRIKYTAYSVPQESHDGSRDLAYLQLPPENGPVAQLAESVAGRHKSDVDKASAIEGYLRNNYSYSLTLTMPEKSVNPVEEFLVRSKKGYCEHYAAGMVVMLRSLGVPSRVVTGFYGGERNEYGGYTIIRNSDAHSWVEALVGGRWKRYDPTPPSFIKERAELSLLWDTLQMTWARYIVGFSRSDQARVFHYIRTNLDLDLLNVRFKPGRIKNSSLAVFISFVVLSLFPIYCIYVLARWARGRKKYGVITLKYIKIRREISKKGIRITSSATSGDIIEKTSGRLYNTDLKEFVRLYESVRFGGKSGDPSLSGKADSLISKIKINR